MTLLELLAVCVILGVLASFTYAVFAGQDKAALDADAKSNARNLLWKVHTCFTATEDYTLCDEPSEQEPPPGVIWGDAPGEAEVVRGEETTRFSVTVRAISTSSSNGNNHVFTISKEVGKDDVRTCTSDGGENNAGGCQGGAW